MFWEGPTDVVAPDYVVDVVSQRHEHRQEDQTVEDSVRSVQPGNSTSISQVTPPAFLKALRSLEETPSVLLYLPYQSCLRPARRLPVARNALAWRLTSTSCNISS